MSAQVDMIENAGDGAVAAWLHRRLDAALARDPGPVAISVPGGSTPFPILEALAGAPLDWRRITVWPGDDRLVEEAHPASNAGRIRALLEPVGAEVVRLSVMEQVPHFALVWLGMGADGHVASLFPNTDPQVDESERIIQLTPDPLPPEAPFDRITLTLPALLDSDEIMFVLRGEEKRRLLEQAIRGDNDAPVARLLHAARQKVTCFV